MLLTAILLTTVACFVAAYLWIIKSRYDHFERRGIPGPLPSFFFGHYKTLWSTNAYSKQLQAWTRQFGSIYGLFEGTRPVYVVSDVEFLQQVYIRQFSSFDSRRVPFLIRIKNGNRVPLFGAEGSRWRRQRHVINPTFSAAKLKLMFPLANGCIEAMITKLSEMCEEKNKEINIYELFKRMAMDVICK
jgi:cytochrome P450 family 13